MRPGSTAATGLVALALLLAIHVPFSAAAVEISIIARFAPEAGNIADVAVMANNHLALLYPAEGRIADYSMNGLLNQHIIREGGVEARFKPVACSSGPNDMLYVYDEASSSVYTIGSDGNIHKGVNLVYPLAEGGATVLSRIGDLWVDATGSIWSLLPDRGVLAAFGADGNFVSQLNLLTKVGDPLATFSRAQFAADGSLFVLDYHQGAVFRIHPAADEINRIVLSNPQEVDALPQVQDFAVDPGVNVLMATYDSDRPLVLLVPDGDKFRLHPISLDLPPDAGRLACKYSGGKYIIWSRESPFLVVLQLR